eukprot:1837992-Amphidinium_carterae.1
MSGPCDSPLLAALACSPARPLVDDTGASLRGGVSSLLSAKMHMYPSGAITPSDRNIIGVHGALFP